MFKRTGKKPERIRSPAIEFAYQNRMITGEEYRACQRGDMSIIGNQLHHFPKQTLVSRVTNLYPNRADDVLIDKLLGKD